MWGRRLKAQNERLRAELRKVTDQRDDARQDAADSLDQVKRLAVQYAEADAAARRVAGRNRQLHERLEDARFAQGDAEFESLYGRLCRALRGCARYRLDAAMLSRIVLSQQLDAATGMDHPDIEAGKDWQARRPDTGPEPKLRAAPPSGVVDSR